MTSLPPAIVFLNGDITYPPEPPPNPPDLVVFIGSQPQLPNSYASVSELTNLQIQLFIDDIMTKDEFDARVKVDPNYPRIVHLRGLRILVILPSFHDQHNRRFADVVMFLHQGMADVLFNRFWHHEEEDEEDEDPEEHEHHHSFPSGDVDIVYPHERHDGYDMDEEHHRNKNRPPGQCYDIQRLSIYELLRASRNSACLPFEMMPHCNACNYPFFCDRCHTFSGIRICRGCKCNCGCGCGTSLIDNQGVKSSVIHAPNCDNEAHNFRFIHRK